MMDYGSRYTDRRQEILARRLMRVYLEAQTDLEKKFTEFSARFEEEDKEKLAALQAGEIDLKDYRKWLSVRVFERKRWKAKIQQAAEVLLQSNRKALTLVRGEQMNVFTVNANRQAYETERRTGFDPKIQFDVYDVSTVDRLIREKPELLPRKTVNGRKDKAWNQGNIYNVITQGILQGESVNKIARRMAIATASTNLKAMTRYARTALTGAQNAGRIETMNRAQEMGIRIRKQWLATLDGRTRDSHQHLDGAVVDINEKFSNGLMYPGDPSGAPGEVYNCRCTLVNVYQDYPEENARRRDEDGNTIRDMSYDEWAARKKAGRK